SSGDFFNLRTPEGLDRAPSWFEYRQKYGAPPIDSDGKWNIHVNSGIFPPTDNVPKSAQGVPLSHTPMNHDNSQLFFAGESQLKYHGYGMHPAKDTASAR